MSTEPTHPNGGRLGPNDAESLRDEDEVSLIDLLLVVARYKRLIVLTVGVFFVLGLLLAVFSSDTYTSSAKVVREIQAEGSLPNIGALSALRGFGLSLGMGTTGLTPEAYPDIVKGREVRLAVVRDTFFFADVGEHMTYVQYVRDHKRGLLSSLTDLPGKVLKSFKGESVSPIRRFDDTVIYLTEDEENAIKDVSTLVGTSVDLESGLMTITATTEDAYLSAELTASFVNHLVERVREILTYKTRRNLSFIAERFEEAELELRRAESRLARFMDRNTSIRSAILTTERDRLQRQVTFKTQLYSDLQAQLTQAELEVQRSEPVITILERPAPAIEPSGMGGKILLVIFVLLGLAVGVAVAFVKWSLDQQMADAEDRAKLDEIRSELGPKNWIPARLRRWSRRSEEKAPESAV